MNKFETLKTLNQSLSAEFLNATEKLFDIHERFKNEVPTPNSWGRVLLSTYLILMHDLFPAARLAINGGHYSSLIILCRSFFEIIIQLKWIQSLPQEKQQEAIEIFLAFEGIAINEKGRIIYNWYELMDPPMPSYKQTAIKLGLDEEIIDFDVNDPRYRNKKMSMYDFFSKAVHLNAKFIKDFSGFINGKHLAFPPNYIILGIQGCMHFFQSMVLFSDMFLLHFFPKEYPNEQKMVKEINDNLHNRLVSLSHKFLSLPEKETETSDQK